MRGEVDKKAKDGLKEEEEVWRNTGRLITEQGEGHTHTHTESSMYTSYSVGIIPFFLSFSFKLMCAWS